MIKNANTDLIAGIVGVILTGFFFFSIDPETSHLSIMFPKSLVIILGLVSAGLVVKGVINGQRGNMFAEGSNVRWLLTGVLLFLWIIAVIYIGFWVSTVAGIFTIVFYLSRARRRVSPAVALGWLAIVAAEVTFFYLVFTRLLHVPLPTGLLF